VDLSQVVDFNPFYFISRHCDSIRRLPTDAVPLSRGLAASHRERDEVCRGPRFAIPPLNGIQNWRRTKASVPFFLNKLTAFIILFIIITLSPAKAALQTVKNSTR